MLQMTANFLFDAVRHLLSEIDILIAMSHDNMKWVERAGGPKDPRILNDPKLPKTISDSIDSINYATQTSEKLFGRLKCEHVDGATRALRYWADHEPRHWSELNTRARALRNAIQVELRQYLYYQYPKEQGNKLRSWKDDWEIVIAAFPTIEREVFEATDCYSTGHSTASVFHSMRVAEYGLRALARERRVKLPKNKQIEWATWHEIIRELDKEIELIGQKRAGAAKDAALAFYSGARADLNGFKDEYRNLAMHIRANYDDSDARCALNNVRSFMARISGKINHKHYRIRWGLR
jgi:hypothetical protein